jgi:hypothetical protein
MGSVWQGLYRASGKGAKGTPIADVVTFKPSFTNFCMAVYEVKVARGDFLHEIKGGKYALYLPHCQRFYFACPSGLVTIDEIPPECGLIVRGDKGWKVAKGAPAREIETPLETVQSMLFHRLKASRRSKALHDVAWMLRQNPEYRTLPKKFGEWVSEAVNKRKSYDRLEQELREGYAAKEQELLGRSPSEPVAKITSPIQVQIQEKPPSVQILPASEFEAITGQILIACSRLVSGENCIEDPTTKLVFVRREYFDQIRVGLEAYGNKICGLVEKTNDKAGVTTVPQNVLITLAQLRSWDVDVYDFDKVREKLVEYADWDVVKYLDSNRAFYSAILEKLFGGSVKG